MKLSVQLCCINRCVIVLNLHILVTDFASVYVVSCVHFFVFCMNPAHTQTDLCMQHSVLRRSIHFAENIVLILQFSSAVFLLICCSCN